MRHPRLRRRKMSILTLLALRALSPIQTRSKKPLRRLVVHAHHVAVRTWCLMVNKVARKNSPGSQCAFPKQRSVFLPPADKGHRILQLLHILALDTFSISTVLFNHATWTLMCILRTTNSRYTPPHMLTSFIQWDGTSARSDVSLVSSMLSNSASMLHSSALLFLLCHRDNRGRKHANMLVVKRSVVMKPPCGSIT